MSRTIQTPDTTVADLIESRPGAREVLRRFGIDTCCGGALTLAEAADLRGITVEEILTSLHSAPEPPPSIGPADSVRAILARYPATVSVFEKHGLMGCGGSAGPDERIDLFAIIHRIDVAMLLRELREAASRPQSEARTQAVEAPAIYGPFLKAALYCTLTLGATFGAYNLIAIHWALGVVPPSHNWAHAGFQLFGFVLLFIMGVAYHALPRFLGTSLAREPLARTTLPLALAGLIFATYGRFGPLLPGTATALLLGAALELASVVAFALVLVATWRRARPAPESFQLFLAAGLLWWVVAGVLLFGSSLQAFAHGDADVAAGWNQAIYSAALFGGTLAFIQGMFLRVGPVFLNLPQTRTALVPVALAAAQAGALLGTIGFALPATPFALHVADAGLLATAASVLFYVLALRPFHGHASHIPGFAGFPTTMRLAFGSSLLFALLGAAYAVLDLTGGSAARLLHDGARHAFALGFVTLTILGMAARILPIFGGVDLRHVHAFRLGTWLVAAGVLMREAQVLAVAFRDIRPMTVSGLSGIVATLGILLAAISLLATLRASSASVSLPAVAPHQVPIAADSNVAALVASHPEALPILISAGFTPLASPVLRRTLARAVTLRQAGRMHHIDVDALLRAVSDACPARS